MTSNTTSPPSREEIEKQIEKIRQSVPNRQVVQLKDLLSQLSLHFKCDFENLHKDLVVQIVQDKEKYGYIFLDSSAPWSATTKKLLLPPPLLQIITTIITTIVNG
jgi:hypothetical protein